MQRAIRAPPPLCVHLEADQCMLFSVFTRRQVEPGVSPVQKNKKQNQSGTLHCFELVRKGNSLAFGLECCGYGFAAFLRFRNSTLRGVRKFVQHIKSNLGLKYVPSETEFESFVFEFE